MPYAPLPIETRDAIAKLCGGTQHPELEGRWIFDFTDHRGHSGTVFVRRRQWLNLEPGELIANEAIWESILHRGLPGLFGVTLMPTGNYAATPTDGSASVFGPTPYAALVAFAEAYLKTMPKET